MRQVIILVVAVTMVACGGGSTRSVEGSVVAFDGDLEQVRSFDVATDDGTLTFVPARDATFHGGPLSHLRAHLVSGEPVVVFYELMDGVNVAVSVEDG